MLSALLFSNTAVYADTVSEGSPSQEVVSETGNTDNLSSTTSSNSSNNLNDTVSGTDITEDNNSNTTTEENGNESERTVSLSVTPNDSEASFDLASMLGESKHQTKKQNNNQPKPDDQSNPDDHQHDFKEFKEIVYTPECGEWTHANVYACECGETTNVGFNCSKEETYVQAENGKHIVKTSCKWCKHEEESEPVACDYEIVGYEELGDDQHIIYKRCKLCGNTTEVTEKCDPQFTHYTSCNDGVHHLEHYKCVCGRTSQESKECKAGAEYEYRKYQSSTGSDENGHYHTLLAECEKCQQTLSKKEYCKYDYWAFGLESCSVCHDFRDTRSAEILMNAKVTTVDGKAITATTYTDKFGNEHATYDSQIKISVDVNCETFNYKKTADDWNKYMHLYVYYNTPDEGRAAFELDRESVDGSGKATYTWISPELKDKAITISGIYAKYEFSEHIYEIVCPKKNDALYELSYVLMPKNPAEHMIFSQKGDVANKDNTWKKNCNTTENWYSKSANNNQNLTVSFAAKSPNKLTDSSVSLKENKGTTNEIKQNIVSNDISRPGNYTQWFKKDVIIEYDNTIVYELSSGAGEITDGEHEYVLNGSNLQDTVTVLIDNTAPTVEKINYSKPTGETGRYYNKNVDISVLVKDANLSKDSSINTKVDNNVSEDKKVKLSEIKNNSSTLKYVAESEGKHVLIGTIKDLAGNCTTIEDEKNTFIIDKTAPTFDTPVYTSKAERLNGKYYNKDVEVSVKVKDLYLSQKSYIEVSGNKSSLEAKADTIKLNVAGEGEHVVTGEIYDLAGNCTKIKDQEEFIIDKTSPKLKISFDNHSFKNEKYYNADRTATFVLTDKYIDGKEASMKFVTVNAKEGSATVNEMTGSNGKYTGTIQFNKDGFYSIGEIKFVDKAGNPFEFTEDSEKAYNSEFVIDKTAPTLKVTFDNHDVKHEKYYKADRKATFAFEDRNIDGKEATMSKVIVNSKEGKATVNEMSGSNGKFTGNVVFDKDGIYSIGDLSFEDKAGNKFVFAEGSEKDYNAEFVIDKTLPTVEVKYDNNSAENGNYYKEARTAEVRFTEKNFTADQVTYERINSDLSVLPALKSYSNKELKNITHIDFNKDGRYGYTLVCEDLAGNISEKFVSDEFIIDMTLPEIEISGVEDMSANNGKVAPVVVSKDTNLTDACTEISLVGSNNGKVTPSISKSNGAETFTYSFADMAHEKENDDLYTLTVKLTDLAGNTVEKSVKYSLNRFGSVFVLSDATKAMVDGYYVTKPQDVVITEINVDAVTKKEVSVAFDGSVKELREGASFSTSDKTNSNGWHSISYNVGKSNFNKDGIYSVTVFSEDRATNKQSNQSKDAEVEFLLDKTAPSVIVSGLEDGGIYEEESHDFSVNVTDTIGVTDMKVYLNDEKLASFTAAELNENGGTEVLTIPTKDDYQKVTIQSTDVAGNVTKVEYNNLLVSVKAEELLLEDNLTPTAKLDAGIPAVAAALSSTKTLAVVGVIAVAALVLAGAFAFKKRKH
ncbi:Ig-like domain-containing protein [Pseudobutyrivibrio xylanivorans]|uniref:Ig-like domain (Group 3) n=1 Tax=Pseudobutyrivibrio xylanivorans DSM 14809 TaxID=1123012 RepID=A0A1M6KR64_PSEXY|nr:Ig-like domain-containing protein [Pseudobutyrivibrio xylanivorans]SHJ61411.1 Ig-like domain (group 3) [Pseudobutyrivibrio xylanivorans DSM 14809]